MGQKLKFNSDRVVTEASEDPMGSSLQSLKLMWSDWILVPFIEEANPSVKHLPFLRELPFCREILGEGSYESLAVNSLATAQSVQ